MSDAIFAASAADVATPSFGTAMPYASHTALPSGAVSDERPSALTRSSTCRTWSLLFAIAVPFCSSRSNGRAMRGGSQIAVVR